MSICPNTEVTLRLKTFPVDLGISLWCVLLNPCVMELHK